MICPNCGATIKDGNVYCEKCGKDIQIVPNFEPEIYDRIDETLSGMFKDVSKEVPKAVIESVPEKMVEKINESQKKNTWKRNLVWILIVLLFLGLGIGYLSANSYAAFMLRGNRAYNNGEFTKSVNYYRKALLKQTDSVDAKMGIAQAGNLSGNTKLAENMLLDVINEEPSRDEAYQLLISIFEEKSDYDSINQLLGACKDNNIYEKYKSYMALPPEFSEEEGVYDDKLTLKLMSDNQGTIYYTLDGSEPSEKSEKYEEPFELGSGKHVVRAVFVNSNGIKSDSVARIYEVRLNLPDKPGVLPVSGVFANPAYISLEIPQNCKVYYTTDGTLPDQKSKEYTDPLPMPVGQTAFKFVAINEDGKRSDLVDRDYKLVINTACRESEAVNFVLASLTAIGQLKDIDGTAVNGNGKYQYTCIGAVQGGVQEYFIIEECRQDGILTGTTNFVPTGNYYAVDTQTCILYRAWRGSNGEFEFENF